MIVVLLLASLLYYRSYYNYGINLLDEGYLLDPVTRVMQGELPYRDFRHFYPPGSFYLFSACFNIFGTDIGVTRLFWAVLHSVAACFAYLIARRFVSPLYALAGAALFVIAPAPWHKSFFVCLPLVCLWVYLKYIDNRGYRWLTIAALTSAGAFLFRQDVALYGCLVFVVMMSMSRDSAGGAPKLEVVKFMFLFVAFVLPVLIFFYSRDALGAFTREVFLSGYKGTKAYDLSFPPFFPLFSADLTSTLKGKLFYLPFLIYVLSAAYLIVMWGALKKDGLHIKYACLLLYGCLVLLQLKNRTDLPHLWQVLPLVYLAAAVFFGRAFTKSARFSWSGPLLMAVLVLGVTSVALQDPNSGSIAFKKGCDTLLDLPRAKVYLTKPRATELREAVGFIEANSGKGDYILALPNIPMLYFLADRKNPTFTELFMRGMTSDRADQERVIQDIEAKRVNLVALNLRETDGFIKERQFKEHSPILYSYIMSHYAEAGRAGDIVMMKRTGCPSTY